MTRTAILLVPLVVLVVLLTVIMAGCGSSEEGDSVVAGVYDAYVGPLMLSLLGVTAAGVTAADVEGAGDLGDYIVLTDCMMDFGGVTSADNGMMTQIGLCHFQGEVADTSPCRPPIGSLLLEGEWGQDGNQVEAILSNSLGMPMGGKDPEDDIYAMIDLIFTGNNAATGTMLLVIEGKGYEGSIQLMQQENGT